ncbi:MAG TPA: heavy metal translocating P-type ATPase [Candidatus Saccharimonadaceae bacterium]|jgi:Cd2+/Zn2+-exporting ATPase|nr:heavy metal translocating P-type ATPase [Candidatus Saccharimonadaceae bacterium]
MIPPAEETARALDLGAHRPAVPGGEGCLEIVAERMRATPGVVALEADFRAQTLTVRYQPSRIDPTDLNALADELAALFAQRVTRCERRASLESCAECALRLGHIDASAAGEFAVTAETDRVGLARRVAPADSVEMRRPLGAAKPWGASLSSAEEEHLAKSRWMAALTGVCLGALILGMVLERVAAPAALVTATFALSALSGGWFALRSTVRALAALRFDVNLLMILAAAGAATIGYVFEGAVLMFLFSLSNTLEVYTMGRTRLALQALLKLRPATALVRRGGREVEVDVESIVVGERVVLKPGEAVPVDGRIALGATLIDQSSLTGESVPVEKNVGDEVFAGTLNQQGAIEIVVTRASGDTTLARIVTLVQQAQEQKSRTEEIAEWVGRYYTIVVMIGAGLMIVVPPFVLHEDFRTSFYRAMTLLVVASPCALVIATPATILSAIASAARNGVLFKGGRFIEALGRVRAIAFDKTGTLTRGRFEVTNVVGLGGVAENDVLSWAASAEKRSPHPLAQAVVRAAEARGIDAPAAEQLTNHLGKGLVAEVAGESVAIGTPELFVRLEVAVPPEALERLRSLQQEGHTAMLVRRGVAWGVIAAADQPRPAAAETVQRLKRLGASRVALLSGDSEPTVAAIAARIGLDEHSSGLLPEDKVNAIAALEARYGAVAMVGDGINDAPALARATVGIVMGGIGSDAALESADVVLMSDDLGALPFAVHLSRLARTVVTQNVSLASGVMLLLVTWVFLGQHTPVGALKLPVAVSAHEGSTVVVILNGLRLLAERRTR